MAPTLLSGERLLVVPLAHLRPGQMVAVRDPRSPDRLLVKRVASTGPEGVDVRGDHAAASTDSRHFGPVPLAMVVGTVVYRYHPSGRSGWIH